MHQPYVKLLAVLFTAACAASAQDFTSILSDVGKLKTRNAKVTGLRFVCVPADCKVRPFEHMQIQVMVDGEVAERGSTKKGRIRRAPGPLKVVEPAGGSVSKPYKFQGADPGGFVDTASGALASILGKASGDFTLFDTVLYVAPEKPGTYTVESTTDGVRGEVKVIVDASATSTLPVEEFQFPAENRSGEKYREIAAHWSPVFAQETWWTPKADYLARWDFDGDRQGDNNWDNLSRGSSQAYVYYSVVETATHWFLTYNGFHPRDYSDKCLAGSCHENDNEGAILVVRKDGTQFGKLIAMETLAHNNLYSYTNESGVRSGVHNIEGRIILRDDTHPVIFIESGGHGMYGPIDPAHSRYRVEQDDFTGGTGVTFVYKGTAERPRHANDRNVGYDLLPILTHWWPLATDETLRMYDEFGAYEPFGGRPGLKLPRVGKTFYGRKESANKAKPFWGWHDNKTLKQRVLSAGQWGLDPAYAFSKNLTFSEPWSLDYTYNPYLGFGDEAPSAPAAVPVTVAANPAPAAVAANGFGGGGFNATTPVAPNASPAAPANEGIVEIAALVDGSVLFHIFDNIAEPELLAGEAILLTKADFSTRVPSGAGIQWAIEGKTGRGKIEIADLPSSANGYRLHLKIEDAAKGAGEYTVRLKWRHD